MFSSTIIALLSAGFAIAAPIYLRDVTLDPAAVAEAQVRDNTATRAFSAAQIQTSSGQCLAVDPASGDFRENLIPIQVVACNGSDTQQWDIITSGVHNNEPGFALVVSTLTNGCLNFDPRRAAGNQVILFSCGGRADGSGAVTNSQLFTFTGGAGPLPLVPQNGNNGTCLTVNENLLDQTSCNPANASGNELFTISASGSQPATSSNTSSTDTETPSSVASSSTVAVSSGVEAVATSSTASAPASTGTTVLDPAAVAQAQVRDDTATRAFSAAEIQTSNGQCLSVDANSGDFRENLIPITVQACDGSSGQQWDVITSGVHNNVNGTALIVSTLTQGCLNFDPRRAAGNQVILFSCGGRADGSGNVTTSQLFTFTGASSSIPLVPTNQANTCLFDNNGNLDVTSCDTTNPNSSELFSISTSATPAESSSPSSSAPSTSAIVTSTFVAPSSAEAIASASSIAFASSTASATVSAPASTGTTILDPAAVAQAQVRDDTATRAFSSAEIQTSDGQCLSVDANSGDFRENLIPITVQACDGNAGQQWDVITSGVHNNVNGTALIVSTLTQGCLNFDPRRAAGNQVILFSCGGRADGSGNVTTSQLFTFTGASSSIPLVPTNQANTCLFDNNGNLDVTSCDTTNPNSSELFSISTSGASAVSNSPATATPSTSATVSSVSAAPSSVEVLASTSSIASASSTASTTVSAPASTGTTILDPAAVAQAQVRDDTATRAFSAAEIQTSDGQCLSVDATSGDFRENLIPITTQTCDGSAGQQWDVITAGVHNNVPGTALFVSTLIQGCLNFDPRRVAGNQVILFSCGGRADGSGAVTTAQLFAFTGNSTTIPLLPANQADTCLFDNNGNLDDTSCDTTNPEADQMFTIVPRT